ncbi:metal-dependent hydrolase [Candidatus Woesearchaeota archaeon]|nr:metal-dependent hydrolase [Candidatus Woesearchaeota archaeon]
MIFRTHLAFGFLIGLIVFYFQFVENGILFFLFLFFGIGFPDVDNNKSKFGRKSFFKIVNLFFKHRGIFHSLIFGIILSWPIYFFDKDAGAGLFLGFLSHIILDSFTKQGVRIFYPLSNLNARGFIKTGGNLEKIIFYFFILLDILVVAKLLNSIIL